MFKESYDIQELTIVTSPKLESMLSELHTYPFQTWLYGRPTTLEKHYTLFRTDADQWFPFSSVVLNEEQACYILEGMLYVFKPNL